MPARTRWASLEDRVGSLEALVEQLRCAQSEDLKRQGKTSKVWGRKGEPSPLEDGSRLRLESFIDKRIDDKLAQAMSSMPPMGFATASVPPSAAGEVAIEVASCQEGMELKALHLDRGEAYAWNASVWDMCMFIGHPCFGWSISLLAMITYVINFLIQLAFCVIVMRSMVGETNMLSEKLDGLLRFRLGIAHSVQYADSVTQRSLANQICTNDLKLHSAAIQLNVFKDIASFQNSQGGETPHLGHWLAVLAQFVWCATVLNEIAGTLKFTQAVLSVPRAKFTRLHVVDEGDSDGTGDLDSTDPEMHKGNVVARLVSISRGRCVGALLGICVPRLFLAGYVCLTGIMYLGETIAMGDLILNAIALAFILDLDELLYGIFMPWRVLALQENLEPVPVASSAHHSRHCGWIQPMLKALLKGVVLAVGMTLIYSLVLSPFHARLHQARNILCSGDTDFVYSVNSATGMVHVSKSREHAEGMAQNWTYVEEVVLQAVQTKEFDMVADSGWSVPPELLQMDLGSRSPQAKIEPPADGLQTSQFTAAGFQKVSFIESWSTEEAAMTLPCSDLMAGQSTEASLERLQRIVRVFDPHAAPVKSCEDVPWQLCSDIEMSELRALCPDRCECNEPANKGAATGFFGHPKYGCPGQCTALVATNTQRTFFLQMAAGGTYIDTCRDAGDLDFFFTDLDRSCTDLDRHSDGDEHGVSCNNYPKEDCAGFDDDDFTATDMCCQCGGGGVNNFSLPLTSLSCSQDLVDECKMIHAPALFWLLYIKGLFQYLLNKHGFEDLLEKSMQDKDLNIDEDKREPLKQHILSGGMKASLLSGDWNFMPGIGHPRNLTGCFFLTSWEFQLLLSIDLCSSSNFASIQRFCPMTCGCGPGSKVSECPMVCVHPSFDADYVAYDDGDDGDDGGGDWY